MIRAEESRRHRDWLVKGHVDATDDQLSWIEAMPKAAKPLAEFKENTKVNLANLEGTPFAALKLLGVVREGPPSSLSRVFSFPNGTILLLREWDYIADGGGMLIPKDRINETVNGTPAILGIAQSPSGKAVSQLSWTTKTKDYLLVMTGHVRGNGMHKKMMELANSIRE